MAQRYFSETGHWLSGGFHDYFMRHGESEGIYNYGYPISEEFHDANLNCTVQYFERARFEWRPDIANNPHDVVLGLVGVELVDMTQINMGEHEAAFQRVEQEQ